ncbi:MAG: acyltransferase domain-containing protein, partial [Proteobacteria bacterium]|nr:acyltransferase domain-containing protein [Pseudomonadota bacterium]
MTVGTPDDIAIIGMSGTFAGAPDVPAFWSNILGKVDAVREAPPDWLGDDSLFDEAAQAPNGPPRVYTRAGGFLGDIARFDPRPYGTMPVAIDGSEPDQFLALKGATAALADAGYGARDFDRENTGIILGHGIHANRGNVNGVQQGIVLAQTMGMLRAAFPEMSDSSAQSVENLLTRKLPTLNVDTVPGLVPNIMTGRIANRLDLMGPNYIIDAACASSLLAVEAAITELRRGRANMMLAGGVNTSTSPLVYMVFCKIGALSRKARVRPFDRSADGTLLGEGQGIVVLKRLEDALRDNDRIYAVIKGSGASSDGRAMGLMAPRLEGEVLAMKRAYQSSGIDPATIDLVEMHGTGIPLGDQLEIQSISRVLGRPRGNAPDVAIGSVKSMIGHCIPAAGMASIIKMTLALHNKVLPPTLADEINPELGLDQTGFFLNTETRPWLHRRDAPRRAAVNAFGFGGINTHMILEEAPGTGAAPTAAFGLRAPGAPELFLLAGDTREALVAAIRDLAAAAESADAPPPKVLAAGAARSLGSGPHRLAVIASDLGSLRTKLLRVADRIANPDTHRLRGRDGVFFTDEPIGGKLAFLFPGENSQYENMLSDLAIASPSVREWLDRLEGLFRDERDVPHRSMMFPPPLGLSKAEREALAEKLHRVDYGSEAVFYSDMAMFTLLRAMSIKPDFIVGHSTGENAAIIASGLVKTTPDQVGEVIRRMNVIFQGIEDSKVVPNGTLLAVGAADRGSINKVLEKHPEIYLTMDNCPNQAILFGSSRLMAEIEAQLTAKGAICNALPLSWAYHTPFVAPMADKFVSMLTDDDIGEPLAPVYSCASAGPFPSAPAAIRSLLRGQYVSRVRFTETVARLYDDGARVFVEVGPGGTLTGFVGDILRGKPHLALASDSTRGSSMEQVLHLLGQLFVHRVPLDIAPLFAPVPEPDAAPKRPVEGPVLKSELPFIHLAPAEAGQLRAALLDGIALAPPAQAAPAPAPGIAAPAAPAPVPEYAAAPAHAEPAYEVPAYAAPAATAAPGGFALLNDFLHGGEVAPPPDAHRALVSGWTGRLPLPFPAAVEFLSAAPQALSDPAFPNAMAPLLADDDIAYFMQVIGPQGPRRQREWLIGRAAARLAVGAWLWGRGDAPAGQAGEITHDAEGRPVLAAPGAPDAVFLSVSHKDGIAVAAAADRPVGIDLERFSDLRDPDSMAQAAFSADEAGLLGLYNGHAAELVTIAWSAKEAVAKALGQRIQGREQSFIVTGFDPGNCTISVTHDGSVVDAFYAIEGDFVCTL